MSTDDAARQDDLSADDASPGPDIWSIDFSDPLADPSANLFSAEIEDLDASDWNVDNAQIWGDETGDGGIDDGGGLVGADFPL